MFKRFSFHERTAVFVLAAVNVPAEVCDVDNETFWTQLWCYHLLSMLAKELDLPDSNISAYVPMLLTGIQYRDMGCEKREEYVVPYLSILWRKDLTAMKIYAMLLVFLFEEGLLDGRGRILLRNISLSLQLSGKETIWIDNILLKFLVHQQASIDHSKQVRSDRLRYAKIGAVAVGAGLAIAFTAGMAAPAVAGALVLMGTTTATAASVAGSMALLFGGTGAGLAGYKMLKRTRGLTDFEFYQYDEKSRMGVMIMVSGWMEEDEDDKRTFGVIPSDENIGMKERLIRYYRLHDPARLADVERNIWEYSEDPQPLYDVLTKRYGSDPRTLSSLIPTLPLPEAEKAQECLGVITEIFQSIADEAAEKELVAARTKPSMFSFRSAPKAVPKADVASSTSAMMPAASTAKSAVAGADGDAPAEVVIPTNVVSSLAADAAQAQGSSSLPAGEASPPMELKEGESVAVVDPVLGQTAEGEAAVAEWDQGKERLSADQMPVSLAEGFKYWHWRELSISPAYELTLLRWELQMQKDLGRSILNLITGLSKSAAKQALTYTSAGLLLAAVSLPMTLISLLDVIDNLWLVAEERADQAGKELAKALLERPQGQRPVTLVGYSMGCRVIFSCLKELADRLHIAVPVMPAEEEEKEVEGHGEQQQAKDSLKQAGGAQVSSEEPRSGPTSAPKAPAAKGPADAPTRSYLSYVPGGGGDKDTDKGTGKQLLPRELKGLVGDVVLLGAPLQLRDPNWARIRAVVGGRIVSGYSTTDLVLSVIYRYQRYKILGVAGIAPVRAAGVENIDLTHLVSQHVDYNLKMKEILDEIDLTSTHGHRSVYDGSNF